MAKELMAFCDRSSRCQGPRSIDFAKNCHGIQGKIYKRLLKDEYWRLRVARASYRWCSISAPSDDG